MASFYLLTDIHYFSKKNWTCGKPVLSRVRRDQIALLQTPEILDSYIEKILADGETDTVIFLGDNVDNGDMNSHYEFRQRLERLSENGKKVFITYATHDYIGAGDDECNFQLSLKFTESATEPLPFMRKAELPDFYYDFTAKNALSVHGESGSYSARLNEKTLLIAIIDNGNGKSFCGLSDDGLEWIESEIHKAKSRNEYVILAVHHPVIAPWEIYKAAFESEMYGGYKKLIEIICRENIKVVFTGHTHVQSIRKYTGENGNSFYDISTASLANIYGKMRKVTVRGDGLCQVESIECDIDGISQTKEELYRQNFPGIWETLLPLAANDFNGFIEASEGYLPEKALKKHRAIIRFACKKAEKMNLLSVAGLSGVKKSLSAAERNAAKEIKLKQVLFEILRHFFTGNAPYTPETVEYKTANGFLKRADCIIRFLKIKKVSELLHGLSFEKIGDDFLYNNRTGDDDSIEFYLI